MERKSVDISFILKHVVRKLAMNRVSGVHTWYEDARVLDHKSDCPPHMESVVDVDGNIPYNLGI